MRVRRPRLRLLDGLLVSVAIVVAIATAAEVSEFVHLRERLPQDMRAIATYVAHKAPGQRFGPGKVIRPLHDLDIACAPHRQGRSSDYRLCLLLRRSGPLVRRPVGGYLRPPIGFDEEAVHFDCFGDAVTFRLCPHARRAKFRVLGIGPSPPH
jgi:hypothetical protein